MIANDDGDLLKARNKPLGLGNNLLEYIKLPSFLDAYFDGQRLKEW